MNTITRSASLLAIVSSLTALWVNDRCKLYCIIVFKVLIILIANMLTEKFTKGSILQYLC